MQILNLAGRSAWTYVDNKELGLGAVFGVKGGVLTLKSPTGSEVGFWHASMGVGPKIGLKFPIGKGARVKVDLPKVSLPRNLSELKKFGTESVGDALKGKGEDIAKDSAGNIINKIYGRDFYKSGGIVFTTTYLNDNWSRGARDLTEEDINGFCVMVEIGSPLSFASGFNVMGLLLNVKKSALMLSCIPPVNAISTSARGLNQAISAVKRGSSAVDETLHHGREFLRASTNPIPAPVPPGLAMSPYRPSGTQRKIEGALEKAEGKLRPTASLTDLAPKAVMLLGETKFLKLDAGLAGSVGYLKASHVTQWLQGKASSLQARAINAQFRGVRDIDQ